MGDNKKILVEVAYATPGRQKIVELKVDEGTFLIEAVRLSRITDHFPEIDLDKNEMGVFGRKVDKHTRLKNLDRVEIYRPLLVDPKEARRRRAARAKARRSGEDAADYVATGNDGADKGADNEATNG